MLHHADEILLALRRRVAAIEAQGAGRPAGRGLTLGVAALDRMLGGGFALGALHEITPAAPTHFGAAVSFALALLARALAAEGAGEKPPPGESAGRAARRQTRRPAKACPRRSAGGPACRRALQSPAKIQGMNSYFPAGTSARAARCCGSSRRRRSSRAAPFTGRGSNCSASPWRA